MTVAVEICCANLKIDIFDGLFEIKGFACYSFGIGVANGRGCLVLNEAWVMYMLQLCNFLPSLTLTCKYACIVCLDSWF